MNSLTIKRKSTLSKKAYDFIKDKIVSGEIKDGDVITEKSIGDVLNMSRTPVKKALVQLELENYVRCVDGVGTIVIGLSIRDLSDIYEVRSNIECLALKGAINKIKENELITLKKKLFYILDMYDNGKEVSSEYITKIDAEFHDIMVRNTKNNYLKHLMGYIKSQIERYQYEAYALTDTGRESTQQHIQILELIEMRDYMRAKTKLKEHIKWSFEILSKALTNIV